MQALAYPPRVLRARPAWIVSLALACAGPPPLPPGVPAGPLLGDSLATLLAKLPHPDEAGPTVEVTELRLLAVDAQPWAALAVADAERASGAVGVIAGRRCVAWQGTRRLRMDRASWFLLRDGQLVAFDHDGFAAHCAPRPLFEPASAADVPLERMLARYVSQRWTSDAVPAEDRLARGLRLLAQGREDDAWTELRALDLRIDELARRQVEANTGAAAETSALREEEERLRPQRAELQRALRGDPSTTMGEL